MKRIRITRHARNRMRWRGIDENTVEQAAGGADWEEPSVGGRINRWKKVGDRFLRVTCRDDQDRVVVISAVFKRTPPGGRQDL